MFIPNIPFMAADKYDIGIYRGTASKDSENIVTKSWTLSHTITDIEIQPVSNDIRQSFEGVGNSIQYEAFIQGTSADIVDGDRLKDPLASSAPGEPNMEVFNVQEWPAVDGLPGYINFLVRRIRDV